MRRPYEELQKQLPCTQENLQYLLKQVNELLKTQEQSLSVYSAWKPHADRLKEQLFRYESLPNKNDDPGLDAAQVEIFFILQQILASLRSAVSHDISCNTQIMGIFFKLHMLPAYNFPTDANGQMRMWQAAVAGRVYNLHEPIRTAKLSTIEHNTTVGLANYSLQQFLFLLKELHSFCNKAAYQNKKGMPELRQVFAEIQNKFPALFQGGVPHDAARLNQKTNESDSLFKDSDKYSSVKIKRLRGYYELLIALTNNLSTTSEHFGKSQRRADIVAIFKELFPNGIAVGFNAKEDKTVEVEVTSANLIKYGKEIIKIFQGYLDNLPAQKELKAVAVSSSSAQLFHTPVTPVTPASGPVVEDTAYVSGAGMQMTNMNIVPGG